MKASKTFIVIAYDISDDKRRYRVVKALKQYGVAMTMNLRNGALSTRHWQLQKTAQPALYSYRRISTAL